MFNLPFFGKRRARMTFSARAASASIPPAMPLWTGLVALSTSTSAAVMPRSE